MNHRDSPLYWAFPAGTWGGTRVRISVFFPLVWLVFCWKLEDLALGSVVTSALFLSVVLHEFGHVVAARRTGGDGQEILIWPLGGLAFVQPAGTFASRFITAASGPLVNLAICLITLWHILGLPAAMRGDAFNPLVMPAVDLGRDLLSAVLVVAFTVNWVLLLVNLIPVFPLDGGRMLQAVLSARLGNETGTTAYIKVGFVFAFLMMFAGLLMGHVFVLFIGSLVLVLNMQESIQLQAGEGYSESFMGYDFSQGYTSLERSLDERPPPRKGVLARWLERRREQRRRREELQEAEDARVLDSLLEKVHLVGMDGLTDAERRQLARASARIRDRGNRRA